jgi:hypothetical protein
VGKFVWEGGWLFHYRFLAEIVRQPAFQQAYLLVPNAVVDLLEDGTRPADHVIDG